MKTVFMVAEKPSLAASLASILSDGKNTTRKGSNGACAVHEWKGSFFNQLVCFRLTSVCGHVLTIDFCGKYNNWDRVEPLELFSCPIERKEATPRLRMMNFLATEARNCDHLVLWLDCDKEGENICFEVIDAVKKSLRRPIYNDDVVWRAHFSSITAKDVKAAMNNLGKPNKNESLSVDARQELDLRIGCAFTRYQTKFFQGKYGNLDSSLISFGPCQTPTLGFCVERHDRIQHFKPEPYWVLQVSVLTKDEREITLAYQTSRIFEKDTGRIILNRMKKVNSLKVTNVVTKDKWKTRPIALNTVELMKYASSGLGYGPHYAMTIAERLYTQGYISYPRTETTSYPENFDLVEALGIFKSSSEYSHYVNRLIKEGYNRPRKGTDIGDHPPITPLKLATYEELGESWKLYDYIVRHFIGTLSHDCKYASTTTTFTAGEQDSFTFVGEITIDPGYTQVMPWLGMSKKRSSTGFQVGNIVPIRNISLVDFKTTPPDYLTESELITLMEKHGIGTDASIPVHINNISQRNYVTVGSGRRLIPTNLGIILVHGYQKIDKDLVEPTVRSKVEIQLNLIAAGKADFDVVLKDVLLSFENKFIYFSENIESMDNLFEVSFTRLSDTGKALSRCGKCRRYMKFIQAKPNRLHCAHCNETYNLPQNGNIRKYKELKCPMDDFELVTWTTGAKGKSFPLCPYCYNNPPFRDMRKYSGCNLCINDECSQSIYSTGISSCSDCDQGVLALDPSSAPKWKVICNKCDTVMDVFEGAHKITVGGTTCSCGAQLLKVEYKEERTKLPGDRTEMVECMFCDPGFESLVRQHRAINSKPAFQRGGGRGRGRGRGRGFGISGGVRGNGNGGYGSGQGSNGGNYNGGGYNGGGNNGGGYNGGGGSRGGRGGRGGRRKYKPKQPKDKMAQLAAYFV